MNIDNSTNPNLGMFHATKAKLAFANSPIEKAEIMLDLARALDIELSNMLEDINAYSAHFENCNFAAMEMAVNDMVCEFKEND